jgi:hypothetical protein
MIVGIRIGLGETDTEKELKKWTDPMGFKYTLRGSSP